jgi:signal transduction histidine kinase
MRVLIVDDDVPMAELLTSVCESDGHEATACTSSLEAIAYLTAHGVDLLITDIAMAPPDGLELVRTARVMQPDLMAIAVTGYWGRYTLPEVLATGALDLMFKPFRVEELRARLAMAAERRRMAMEEKGRAHRIAAALEKVRVLLIHDSPADARTALRDLLERGEVPDIDRDLFEVTHVTRLEDAMGHLNREGVDVVILDLDTSVLPGLGAVERLHAAAPSIPLVVLTARGTDRSELTKVIQAGAQDCLVKGKLKENPLQRVLLHAIERQRLQADSESVRQQQQQLREELVLHELQLKDEFMSHVSHELRSPLTAIHQFSSILMDELAGPLNEDQREAVRIMIRNINQLESMIGDLLEITRMQNGKLSIQLQSVLVSELVDDALDTMRGPAQAKGVHLVHEVADDLPTAYADPVRARQILDNLVGNAVKFTPALGSITVRAMRDDDEGFLRFEVADTGCGLSLESTERIFERLYQVKAPGEAGRKGLGLGLFICKELVIQQGGRIWVKSDLNKGSTFFFTLPVFGRNTPLRTHEFMIKRDLLARVDRREEPMTSAHQGEVHG